MNIKINCVKMTNTCQFCQRSNIRHLTRHYGYCLHFQAHINPSIDTISSPTPTEKTDEELSVKKDNKTRKVEELFPSPTSLSPEQSSKFSHITNSYHDNFSYNEDNNITSHLQNLSSFSDGSNSLSPFSTHLLSEDIGSYLNSNEDDDFTAHPDTSLLHKILHHHSKHLPEIITSQKSELRIYHFLRKIKAPLYAYDELMKLLYDITLSGHEFDSNFTSQRRLIESMNNRYDAHGTTPIVKEINLERGNAIKVVTFDFLEMLRSLLTDPQCMSEDNLTFPNNDPHQGPRTDGVRNEIHTGVWYKDAWNRRCLDDNDFLLAIPIFIDSSNTDVLGKNKIEPVQFTLSIFKRECRRNFLFWRPLGFINDLSPHKLDPMVVSDGEAVSHPKQSSASNLRNYHRIVCNI